ncbi:hypothetical protein GOODEAATRI_029035, partial [Goodea atripinnis]
KFKLLVLQSCSKPQTACSDPRSPLSRMMFSPCSSPGAKASSWTSFPLLFCLSVAKPLEPTFSQAIA